MSLTPIASHNLRGVYLPIDLEGDAALFVLVPVPFALAQDGRSGRTTVRQTSCILHCLEGGAPPGGISSTTQ